MAEEGMGQIRMLSRMNGWQRLWFVFSALALVIFGLLFPYREANQHISSNFHYRESLAKDYQSGRCSAYINQPLNSLREPPFESGGRGCWHIYTSRFYAKKDTFPYTLAVYDAEKAQEKLEGFFTLTAIYGGLTLAGSALLYFAGFLVAWVRRGFAQMV